MNTSKTLMLVQPHDDRKRHDTVRQKKPACTTALLSFTSNSKSMYIVYIVQSLCNTSTVCNWRL